MIKWPRPFPIEGMPQSYCLEKSKHSCVMQKHNQNKGVLLWGSVSTPCIRKITQQRRPVPVRLAFFNLFLDKAPREEMLVSLSCSSKYILIFTILCPQYVTKQDNITYLFIFVVFDWYEEDSIVIHWRYFAPLHSSGQDIETLLSWTITQRIRRL